MAPSSLPSTAHGGGAPVTTRWSEDEDEDDDEDDNDDASMLVASSKDGNEDAPLLMVSSNENAYDGYAELQLIKGTKPYENRWRSIRIMYIVMFVGNACFSMVLPSLVYYVESDRVDASEFMYSTATAAFSMGQFIGSPVIGLVASRFGIKRPLITCSVVLVTANLLYTFGYGPKRGGVVFILVARFLAGLAGSTITLVRSYIAQATTSHEVLGTMIKVAAVQTIAISLAPAFSALFGTIRTGTYLGAFPWLVIDSNTGPGWLGMLLAATQVMAAVFFEPHNVTKKSAGHVAARPWRKNWRAIGVLLMNTFQVFTLFSVYETLVPVMTRDFFGRRYGWDKDGLGTTLNGVTLGVGAMLGFIPFMLAVPLSKRVGEHNVLLVGQALLFVGYFLSIPFGPKQSIDCEPVGSSGSVPAWCAHTPSLPLAQFIVASIFNAFGYPLAIVINVTLFSKILGPINQGLWMGIYTSVSALSRAIGPFAFVALYGAIGPRYLLVIMVLMIVTQSVVIFTSRYHLDVRPAKIANRAV